MRNMHAFTSWVDSVIDQAGPPPSPPGKIVPVNGGFELQQVTLMTSGKWEYKREAWSRNHADMVDAARLRNLNLGGN